MGARHLLHKGMMWLIGDHSNAKVWGDHWIPSTHGITVLTPLTFFDQEAYMQELINHDTRTWGGNLL